MDNDIVEKLAAELPADLVYALRTQGLAKVASALNGVPADDEHSVYRAIGASLFFRRKEAAMISAGLRSLGAVEGA